MHLLAGETGRIDDGEVAVDLAQPPGDIVILSAADSELAALAAAVARRGEGAPSAPSRQPHAARPSALCRPLRRQDAEPRRAGRGAHDGRHRLLALRHRAPARARPRRRPRTRRHSRRRALGREPRALFDVAGGNLPPDLAPSRRGRARTIATRRSPAWPTPSAAARKPSRPRSCPTPAATGRARALYRSRKFARSTTRSFPRKREPGLFRNRESLKIWIPACAGMSGVWKSHPSPRSSSTAPSSRAAPPRPSTHWSRRWRRRASRPCRSSSRASRSAPAKPFSPRPSPRFRRRSCSTPPPSPSRGSAPPMRARCSTGPASRSCRSSSPARPRRPGATRHADCCPRDLTMGVVLPEVDGRLSTRAISFKAETLDPLTHSRTTSYVPVPDRVAFVARQAASWVRLARKAG